MSATGTPLAKAAARCACGGAGVAVDGRPLSMLMCSCEACQKATGSGHSAFAIFAAGDVTLDGETRAFSRPANSGATFTRWFCPTCGTTLYGRSSRAETLTIVPIGLFGSAADWYRPSQLIFARSHHDWDTIDPALPRWTTYRDEEGYT